MLVFLFPLDNYFMQTTIRKNIRIIVSYEKRGEMNLRRLSKYESKKSSLDGFFAIKRVIIKVKIVGEEEEIGWLTLK